MADTFRYQWGDTKPRVENVATAQAVEIGDLTQLTSGAITRASDETWDTDLATTQANFITNFFGVSMQRKVANEASAHAVPDNRIRVATAAVFELDCDASDTYNVGDLVGPAKQTGNLLENQKVASVAGVTMAIGRVAEKKTSTTLTTVKVEIMSKVCHGGVQA